MAKKKRLHISFVLDETGSMNVVRDQTVRGFNEYLETLKADKAASKARFTLTRFNSEKLEVAPDGVRLADVGPLADYAPANLTPLYDAVGRTVRALEKRVKDGDGVLLVIQTDGYENASTEYNRDAIFALIKEKKEAGWTVAFLGADQDAWAAGQAMGLDKGNVMAYAGAETRTALNEVAEFTSGWSASGGRSTSGFFDNKGQANG